VAGLRAASVSGWSRMRSSRGRRELPRKEVIQPQLPLRLPCYDFVPIASPTLDSYRPAEAGSDHRLRVVPTLRT
jgi:hypothetical protein